MPDRPDVDEFLFEWLNSDAGVLFRRGRLLESVTTPYQKLEVFETPQRHAPGRLCLAQLRSQTPCARIRFRAPDLKMSRHRRI